MRKLGIKGLTFHDLRRSCLTRLSEAGEDIYTISKISGHKSLDVLKRYIHPSMDSLRRAVNKANFGKKKEADKN